MRRQRPLDVQALTKEIAAELRAKYDLKAAQLASQRGLITKFDHDPSRAVGSARHRRCSWPIGARQEQRLRAHPQATAAQAATRAPRPPSNARVETVTTKPFFREFITRPLDFTLASLPWLGWCRFLFRRHYSSGYVAKNLASSRNHSPMTLARCSRLSGQCFGKE
jgi:hypothetical protein